MKVVRVIGLLALFVGAAALLIAFQHLLVPPTPERRMTTALRAPSLPDAQAACREYELMWDVLDAKRVGQIVPAFQLVSSKRREEYADAHDSVKRENFERDVVRILTRQHRSAPIQPPMDPYADEIAVADLNTRVLPPQACAGFQGRIEEVASVHRVYRNYLEAQDEIRHRR
jgi:hypothetical protein